MVILTALAGTGAAVAAFATGTAVVTGAAAFTTANILIGIATNVVLGMALNALTPKPSVGSGASRGYQVNSRGSALDHAIIYGETKVGGAIVFDETTGTNNKFLHRVIAVAGHEVDSFQEIYINDDLVTLDGSGNVTSPSRYNSKVRINTHLGSPTQLADSDLVAESANWTSNHRLRGIAYMYVRFSFDADVFPNGIPTITAVVRGKKVYNPATEVTEWSDNPALCLRDYIATASYGLGEADANIDDTLVSAAATVCAQTDTLATTTRYTCNGSFTTGTTPYDLIDSLLTSMGGSLWYSQGKWRMKPSYWTTPNVAFTEDDLRSSVGVSTRHSRRDNFNTVKGTFRGSETNWQVTDYPEVTNASFVTVDNGQVSTVDIDLPFTDNSIEARRIARIALESNRQQLMVTASFGLRALEVQVGDNITLTNTRFGWVAKEFEVVSWSFGFTDGLDLQVDMMLKETAESVFDEVDDGIVYERDNTTLLSPFDVPTVGLSIDVRLQILKEKLTNLVTLTTTSGASERVDYVEAQFKATSDTEWKSAGTGVLGKFEVSNLDDGLYDFRARAINTFGVKGEWTNTLSISAEGLAQPPQDVGGFTSEVNGAVLQLEWSAVTDLDLSYYRIRYSPNTGVTVSWANSVNYSDKVPRPATSVTVPARAGTFLIKAIDKSGVESTNATSLVVRTEDLEQFATTLTQTEDPTFDGAKTDCVVVDNTLRIADVALFDDLVGNIDSLSGNWDDLGIASVGTSASYEFSDYIDTGAVRRARVRVDSYTERFDSTGNLLDDLAGNVDTLPGLWDDLTALGNFADTNVKAFVSTTEDDPTGTPTWTSYTPIRVSDVSARAFRFKINLESNTSGITPTVTELDAVVQHN